MNRKLIGAALLATLTFAPAQTVFAHGGNGGSSSDYRIEVIRYDGNHEGVTVRPVELGNRMELVRTTTAEVQILGYEGEPYIRLNNDGVFENVNSPAHYVNLDRFSRTPVPPSATAKATPKWVKISDGNSVRWHDHRTHWMDTTPRQDVRDNPNVEHVIFEGNRVDLLVDGKSAGAIVQVTWLPPPSRLIWLAITTIGACALLAALVLVPSLRHFIPLISVIAAVACFIGSGHSTFRILVSALAIVLAAVGWALKNRWLPVISSLIVVVLAITHFEVFEHQLLAGWAPAVLQRVAIGVALAFGAAVVGCELVVGLGSTTPVLEPEPEPVGADS
ncbi:MAG TPA: hypothetical protein VIH06_05500 [Ilumatobacteraceae bacterium]